MAPMWSSWACVRTSASNLVQPVLEVAEVGQDQVHAGLVGIGEQHAAVHHEQAAAVLEDRHVPADLADPAQGDDAQAFRCQRGRQAEIRVRVAHARVSPGRLTRVSPSASRHPR